MQIENSINANSKNISNIDTISGNILTAGTGNITTLDVTTANISGGQVDVLNLPNRSYNHLIYNSKITGATIYSRMSSYLPSIGNKIKVTGCMGIASGYGAGTFHVCSHAERIDSNTIYIYVVKVVKRSKSGSPYYLKTDPSFIVLSSSDSTSYNSSVMF